MLESHKDKLCMYEEAEREKAEEVEKEEEEKEEEEKQKKVEATDRKS